MARALRVGIIGGGMFFDDVIGDSFIDFEHGGFAGALTGIGMSRFAPQVADIAVNFVAIGTRSPQSRTADKIREQYLKLFPQSSLKAYYGEAVWQEIIRDAKPDVLFVAGPDHMHQAAILDALNAGIHVITEKPMCLKTADADAIIAKAQATGLIVAVDMHKRYDPFVRQMMLHSLPRYGRINRVRAVLEEPLAVATEIFKWAEQSNPFAYVGCHWLDVVAHYLNVKPRAIYATGEKNLLVNWDRYVTEIAELKHRDPASFSRRTKIDTWDSLNVNITYDNGMRGDYNNSWINPEEFEGAVNQEIELYGVLGRGFVDQQDRGFRETITGDGTRTRNPTFNGRVRTPGGTELCGYGKASIVAGLLAISRAKFLGAGAVELVGTYPDAASQRSITMIIEAATAVAERNFTHFQATGSAPVTAALTDNTISLLDPTLAKPAQLLYRRKP